MSTSLIKKQKQLDTIAEEVARCKICQKDKIGVAVPGEGNPDAQVVFIGEAPGKEEAKTGRPFIGRAGKVLRSLIAEIGLHDTDIFITSPVKYLPIYVTPNQTDIEHGRVHLMDQLAVIQPKVVVLMGNVATIALLQRKVPISKEHGTFIERGGITYMIIFHPAAPLYNPNVRELLVDDFKKLKKFLKNTYQKK
jgi:DNA polymerase